MTKTQWKEAERPLQDTPEGQEVYDLLLKNIERQSAEDEAVHIEIYKEVKG